MLKHSLLSVCLFCLFAGTYLKGDENLIEEQLQKIGEIPNDEIIVVQKKYTRKEWRHELTPLSFGGLPFGSERRTLVGGASYTLHFNDWLAWEALNFVYSKNFFSSFTQDINDHAVSGQQEIRPDIQKLLFLTTTGLQISPFYGKVSTFSSYIAYIEPFLAFGVGMAKTETNSYMSFYPGIGLRVFFREWVSLRVEFRDYIYKESFTDRTTSETTSAFRNNYAITASLSFWLPKMP